MPQFSLESLAATEFNWETALSLAWASKLSYEDRAAVVETGQAWGLPDAELVERDDTQCLIGAAPEAALIAFRGTESVGDWLINLNIASTSQLYGVVHEGFHRGFAAVKLTLEQRLAGYPGRSLLLTGHSLGGALATIAAAVWHDLYPVQGVYTFGQPAVGRGSFISFMAEHYGDTFFRFVNDDDLVPRVPPNYQHVGRLFHFDATGNVRVPTTPDSGARIRAEAEIMSELEFDAVRRQLRQRRNAVAAIPESAPWEDRFVSLRDHKLDAYIDKISAQPRLP